MIDAESPLVGRFLEWCSHLSQNQLAHVIFVTSIKAAMRMEKVAGLKEIRDLMYVDFPNEKRVHEALSHAGTDLTDAEQELVIDKLGGSMTDMVKVIYAVKRGTPVGLAVEDRIVEATQSVEKEVMWLSSAIIDAVADPKLCYDTAARICRFFRLMQLFKQKPKIRRSELLEAIFGIHSKELRGYVEHGLLTYTLEPVTKRLVGDHRLRTRFPRMTWPDEWIAVGSPCMREAFTRVLDMPHYRQTYKWAGAVARGFELEESENELCRIGDRLKIRSTEAAKETETLARTAQQWAGLCEEGDAERIVNLWRESHERTLTLSARSEAVEEELAEVQRERRVVRAVTLRSDRIASPQRFNAKADVSSRTPGAVVSDGPMYSRERRSDVAHHSSLNI